MICVLNDLQVLVFVSLRGHLLPFTHTVEFLVGIVPQEELREFCYTEQGPSTGIAPPNGILTVDQLSRLEIIFG